MEPMRCSLATYQSRAHVPVQQLITSPEVRPVHQRLGFVSLQHRPVNQQQWKGVGAPLQRAMQVAAASARCRQVALSAGDGLPTVASAVAARKTASSPVAAAAAAGAYGSGCETATRRSPSHQVHTKKGEEATQGASALTTNDCGSNIPFKPDCMRPSCFCVCRSFIASVPLCCVGD